MKYGLETSVPNIVIAIRIFLTMGISVASCEKSFSELKLIKNYLLSTMNAARLNNLAILSIENETLEDLDRESEEFQSNKISYRSIYCVVIPFSLSWKKVFGR